MPARGRAKPSCRVINVVQELTKLLGNLELLTQTLSQFFSLCFAFGQANAFIPKKLIHALNMGGEFFDLLLVARFGLRKMSCQFLDLRLVPRFCLCKELVVEIFDLRRAFGNEGVQPTHRSWKQVGLVRFRSLGGRRRRPSTASPG